MPIQEYHSNESAREFLREIGIPEDALDFYFSQLLPCLPPNQELTLPEMSIPMHELSLRGFRFAATG
jgi:hypothetical protein